MSAITQDLFGLAAPPPPRPAVAPKPAPQAHSEPPSQLVAKKVKTGDAFKSWGEVALSVLAGGWDNATASEREAAVIGLRGRDHEPSRKAVAKLDPKGAFTIKNNLKEIE